MEFVVNVLPRVDQAVTLYNDAGWLAYTRQPDRLMQALKNSLYLLCAYEDGELVGLLRAVGDGITVLFVQDILVLQGKRRQGLGGEMLHRMMAAYPDVRQKVLLTDETPEMHGFYEKMGFCTGAEVGLTAFYYMGEPEKTE